MRLARPNLDADPLESAARAVAARPELGYDDVDDLVRDLLRRWMAEQGA